MTLVTDPAVRPAPAPPRPRRVTTGEALAALVLALMLAASLGGLLADGFYTDGTWARAAFRGNDLATLVLAVPLLAGSLVLTHRGSPRARLVLLGMLGYGAYNYAFYVFGSTWSDWFLLHVAAFGASLYALVVTAATTDLTRLRVAPGGPRRAVAAYLVLVAVVLAGMWSFASIDYAVTGELGDAAPPEALHVIFAVDTALLAPALAGAGVLLWRRTRWGVPAAVAANVLAAVYQVALAGAAQFQADAGAREGGWFTPTGAFVFVASAAAVVSLLRRVRR